MIHSIYPNNKLMKERKEQRGSALCFREGLYVEEVLTSRWNSEVMEHIDRDQLTIRNRLNVKALQVLLSCVKTHDATKIDAVQGFSSVLLYICDIAFPNLTSLNLGSSEIQSLEILPKISLPQLRKLWVGHNSIVSIRPLRKAHFPNLQELSMTSNRLNEFDGLSAANLSQLKGVRVKQFSGTGPQNVYSLMKLSTNALTQFWSFRRKQIDRGIKIQVQKKFPELIICYCLK